MFLPCNYYTLFIYLHTYLSFFFRGSVGTEADLIWKMLFSFRPFSPGLDNQVDFHDSIIERIVNFYHAHENLFDYITTYL